MIRHLAKIPVVLLIGAIYWILHVLNIDGQIAIIILEVSLLIVLLFALWDIRPQRRIKNKVSRKNKEKSE